MLAPATYPGRQPTFKGIASLHIPIHGLTCDLRARWIPLLAMLTAIQWFIRLVSITTHYPHVKNFSIKADLIDRLSLRDAFQLSIDLLHQYQGDSGVTERLYFTFTFLDDLEIDCRRKREVGACEWDVRSQIPGCLSSGFWLEMY
jgi:hypothetical protein